MRDALLRLYRDHGGHGNGHYPKSHWPNCRWAPDSRIVLSGGAPAGLISCNACLRHRRYIRVVSCNPRLAGWPMAECEICDYGLDHETWLRVRGVGEDVQKVLEQLNADAYHPVTWAETGLVPFHEGDIFFASKEALAQYYDGLMDWMSGASPWATTRTPNQRPYYTALLAAAACLKAAGSTAIARTVVVANSSRRPSSAFSGGSHQCPARHVG